jgi:hypothetical protein
VAQIVKIGRKRRKTMTNELEPGQPVVYQIRIKGQLDPEWTDWFEGLAVTLEEDGNSLLTGEVIDQAALHGLLKKMRDLGLPLVSVSPVKSDPSTQLGASQADAPDIGS